MHLHQDTGVLPDGGIERGLLEFMKSTMKIETIKNLDATVKIPGSKSFTQRALIIASLAEGKSCLHNALISDDTDYLITALRLFGVRVLVTDEEIVIEKTSERMRNPGETIYLGNNGTSLRFLTSLAALATGEVIIDGGSRLRKRPVGPVMDALRSLGVKCRSLGSEGYPPVVIEGGGINGGRVTFRDTQSSQYISSLLIVAPCAKGDVEIELLGNTASRPYIDLTIDVMNRFGVDVIRHGDEGYTVKAPQTYRGQDYTVESDLSNASYFFLAAALCKGKIRVPDINPDTIQGDMGVLGIMEQMGSSVIIGKGCIDVVGKELIPGDMEFDMASMPDMVPTVAVLAAFREGRTVITNVAHLRLKECDRISAVVTELNRIGIDAKELDDGLVISGGTPRGAEIETYEDHRMAMAFAIAGLVTEGIEITDVTCVNKSFPRFWDTLNQLYRP